MSEPNKGIFRQVCPSCRALKKIVFKCRKCYKLTCAECSVRGMCSDCYVKLNEMDEIETYMIEKYGLVI